MARIGPGPEWQVSEQKLREPTFKIIQSQTADFANKAAVKLVNRTSRKLPFVQFAFFQRLRLLLWISSNSANVSNVEGFRASSDARKPHMQEPALGSAWPMGISDSGGVGAVLYRFPDGVC